MLLRHPSRGTKAVIFLPFFINCTRTHFRIAELGCLASTPLPNNKINYSCHIYTVCKTTYYYVCYTYTFSNTMPLAWEAPPNGLAFHLVPKWAFL